MAFLSRSRLAAQPAQQPAPRARARAGRPRVAVAVAYKSGADGGSDRFYSQVPTVYTATDAQSGGLCPHSQAVLIALLEKDLPGGFREVKVDLAQKPAEFKELYHSIIPDKDVRERVPVLVNGPHRLVESAAIVEYLDAAFKEHGTPLTPPDAFTAARVKLFTQYFQDHVVPAYSHLVKANEAGVAPAKEELMKALAAVDEFLALHGSGEGDYAVGPHWGWSMSQAGEASAAAGSSAHPHEHYLMGPFYTSAEVLCTPFVARMVEALPEWRGMDVLAECEARRLARVAGWMRACLARPSAKKTSPTRKELVEGLVEWEWSHAV